MNKRAFTLVEIIIVVAIIALLASIAIPVLLRARIIANDSAAQATLKSMANAYEAYAAANSGLYPTDEANLTSPTPPYLGRTYDGQTIAGYTYAVTFANNGYAVTATPNRGQTGSVTDYRITTGGILSSNP